MTDACRIYVGLIDGTSVLVPVAAVPTSDGTFRLLENDDFDPTDSSTLYEYLPGDEVRAMQASEVAEGRTETMLRAIELARSTVADGEYWHALFRLARGNDELLDYPDEMSKSLAARICEEVDRGLRWHYPTVFAWARRKAHGNAGE